MKKQFIICLLIAASFTNSLFSQIKIGNNPTTIGSGSLLELESINKGLVIPRMTGAQMNAIASPVAGMFIYNLDSSCICQYMGTAWRSLCGGNIGSPYIDWHILGNAGTVDGTNFLGTTDNIPFNIRVNNQKAGRIDNTNGNAFFGYQSGNSNSGTSNTFTGHQAGLSNTSGAQNSFIGYSSGYSNTSGYQNTFAGDSAGFSNTTGFTNNAFGYRALKANTTGIDNAAFGQMALTANISGNNNVACGNYAIAAATTASDNTAVGYATLYRNTSGGRNTVMG